MITQSIEVHKVTYSHSSFPHSHPSAHHWVPPPQNPNAPYANRAPMGKLEYAMYFRDLGYSKGDFVVYKESQKTGGMYTKWQVQYVTDILEVHHMIKDWGTNRSGPRCTESVGYGANPERLTSPTWNGGSMYQKIEPEEVPTDFKKLVDDYLRNKSTPPTLTAPDSTAE